MAESTRAKKPEIIQGSQKIFLVMKVIGLSIAAVLLTVALGVYLHAEREKAKEAREARPPAAARMQSRSVVPRQVVAPVGAFTQWIKVPVGYSLWWKSEQDEYRFQVADRRGNIVHDQTAGPHTRLYLGKVQVARVRFASNTNRDALLKLYLTRT